MIVGNSRVRFTLENMKFGLTAYPATPVEVSGNQVIARPQAPASAIIFDKRLHAFTLCDSPHCAREYRFVRL